MRQGHEERHDLTDDGIPDGGHSKGIGFSINWQRGPLGQHADFCVEGGECGKGCTRVPPNGAFVEDVIAAAIGRIEHYESTRFACNENKVALFHLKNAARVLDERTKNREARGVEGTHGL